MNHDYLTELDADIPVVDTETNRSEYEPKTNALFIAADTGAVYRGDGDEWTLFGTVTPDAPADDPTEPKCPDPESPAEPVDPTEPDTPPTEPLTEGAFLFEGFEDRSYNMIEMPDDTGGYVPDHPEAVVLSDYARTGNTSFRLRVDYDWEYPAGVRRGTNKPIPDHRSTMASKGYSVYGEPFWFAFSLGLDEEWKPDSHVEQVQEFHRDLSKNPGDTLSKKKDYSGSKPGKPISTWVDGNRLKFRNSYVTNGQAHDDIIDGPRVSAGNWYDIVMNLKWVRDDMDDTGFIRVWVNDEQVMDYTGNTTSLDVAPPRPPELRIYKWLWNQSRITPDEKTRTYYFDEVRYGWADATYEDMRPGERPGTSGESVYPEWWPF